MDSVKIIIKGKHNTGKTSLANLLKSALEEYGYKHVSFTDAAPMPYDQKPEFTERFKRNREERPVQITVEIES